MTTQSQSSGDGARDCPWTGSTAADADGDGDGDGDGTASHSCSPRKFGQVPQLTVPDNFDQPLTDTEIAYWEFHAGPTQ
jgi:hypothetical protein